MAEGLLPRIDRSVTAEQVERLVPDAKGAAVADGADRPRAMLVLVVATLAWTFNNQGGQSTADRQRILPTFVLLSFVLAAASSLGLVPAGAGDAMRRLSRWRLVCAIAALGMKTSLQELAKVGWPALALAVAETLFLLIMVLAAVKLAGRL